MDVKITSANCEIISSGLVTSFNGESIDISLPSLNNTRFHIKFEFIKDESTEKHRLQAKSGSEEIVFLLTNFAKPLGTGTIKPINFGTETNTGKKLYINFYVYSVGEANPTLQYTIYKDERGEDNA
ncbi:DUF6864 domain-containing function [uncultured Intestinimonas sp.]|uniref:DUF6864 domain-containing function n=1 Tax=uncultured Intestinimonas sp. TaxID=1689265 RepID=UPI0025FFD769|nr:hypothetical protein [uncultured Intestinimonas sp.]